MRARPRTREANVGFVVRGHRAIGRLKTSLFVFGPTIEIDCYGLAHPMNLEVRSASPTESHGRRVSSTGFNRKTVNGSGEMELAKCTNSGGGPGIRTPIPVTRWWISSSYSSRPHHVVIGRHRYLSCPYAARSRG